MARSGAARQVGGKVQRDKSTRATGTAPAAGIATSLDRLLHDRMRLGIVSALAAADGMSLSFTELKSALSATDGNLGGHVRKLEDAGYVSCDKTFEGRTPRTDYRLTTSGRRALEKYLDHLDAIIRATRSA
ncbi:MAG: winged helix-turn-helix domain-containing protein [Vicinamibacterales bacterium]